MEWILRFACSPLLVISIACAFPSASSAQQTGSGKITAAPEMQRLLNAMTGIWSMSLNYAPTERISSGGTGSGHVIFRSGPGGLSLIEDEYSKDSTGEQFGLSVTWWDEAAKGFHALWCDNHLPTGCIMMSKLAHWQGEQFVLGDEFERDGRKYEFREVVLDLTDKSYRQQLFQGLVGGELKEIVSIQANREPQAAQPKTILPEAKLHMPGPDVQNLMLGTWSTQIRYAPTPEMPNGGMGSGTEIWRPGPGGLSVIEEEHEKNPRGETDGFSIGWWDEQAGGQRFIWCANDVPQGCVVPNDVAKWEGERLVFREDRQQGGRKMTHAEIFSDITRDSFTQILQEGEAGKPLKNTVMISATRKSQGSMALTQDKNSDATLLALTNEWTDAINSRDRQKLDALMASDFALYHWNGDLAAPRLQWLDNLFNHIKIQTNTLTDSAPQAYGDFGIVTSVGDWIGSFDGKPFSQKCIVADTWRKIENQWKVIRRTSHCYTEDSVSGRVNWKF